MDKSSSSEPCLNGPLLTKALAVRPYAVRLPKWAKIEPYDLPKSKQEVLAEAEERGLAEAYPKKRPAARPTTGLRPLSLQTLAGIEIVSHCDVRSLHR